MSLSPQLIDKFAALVGDTNALRKGDDQEPFLTEWRDKYRGQSDLILCPQNTDQVSRILKLASSTNTKIVPQGGNTGLVGGQLPLSKACNEIVLSLKYMTNKRSLDALGKTIIVEAGVTIAQLQTWAEEAQLYFPLTLASEGSCTVGGTIASNAGGVNVLRYGMMADQILGLEVVLANGDVLSDLSGLYKDNSGYHLSKLFAGSEGTLGIVTAACLKLQANPHHKATAFVALETIEQVAQLYQLSTRAAGDVLTGFELMSGRGLDFVCTHIGGARSPFKDSPHWAVLIEFSSSLPGVNEALQKTLLNASDQSIIEDGYVAQSAGEAKQFWLLRESMSSAQKGEGGSIKHDISVPVSQIPAFIHEAGDLCEKLMPSCRPVPFGHFGDGNLHYNISQPIGADKQGFLARWDEVNRAIYDLVLRYGGSISAEHGIGVMKRDLLADSKQDVQLALMRQLKQTFDPNFILNPNKLL